MPPSRLFFCHQPRAMSLILLLTGPVCVWLHVPICVCLLQVYNRLSGQYNREAIDNALQSLMAEAHIYNTVDDNHWKAA